MNQWRSRIVVVDQRIRPALWIVPGDKDGLTRQVPLSVSHLDGIGCSEQRDVPLDRAVQTDHRVDTKEDRQIPGSRHLGPQEKDTVERENDVRRNRLWGVIDWAIAVVVEHTGAYELTACAKGIQHDAA